MGLSLSTVAFLVKDYDEAISFFTTKLGFIVLEDTLLDSGKRWVVVSPGSAGGTGILLSKAIGEQVNFIGKQGGGRVFLFLRSDDFNRDYNRLLASGVSFCEQPRRETYGDVAVFEDLYGNRWDLVGSSPSTSAGLPGSGPRTE